MSKQTNKHTPGPWRVETLTDSTGYSLPDGPIHLVLATIGPYPSTVCSVEEYNEVPGATIDRLADAHLIAAAPDLLSAVRLAELTFRYDADQHAATGPEGKEKACRDSALADRMAAAIAKAEGRQ